ncbi:MAG: hypothetical protein J6E49_01935 [Acidaminococcaceae bacterium]|nr:hypothetical protein [Acidaminococcaceae bacterium]MBQ5344477.1 hypothetical protein [Acidaminococcaceae bacterium]MBR1662245.1 hypothetical protein [Acidaminococcaceae bacterium]
MEVNKNGLTKEQIEKAMACETVEELMALAKSEGIELTKDEAEAYFAELSDFELEGDILKQAAGGQHYFSDCPKRCIIFNPNPNPCAIVHPPK